MARVTVRFARNGSAFYGLLQAPNGTVGRFLTERAINVRRRAEQLAPVDTGRLRGSHDTRGAQVTGTGKLTATVSNSAPYAKAVHEGVPGPIVPRNAKALVFEWMGELRFAKSVAGQPANGWILEAFRDVARADPHTDVIVPAD